MATYEKDLCRVLRENGCYFVRHGGTCCHFTVDGKIKSRHTANGVLKEAGLPKQF